MKAIMSWALPFLLSMLVIEAIWSWYKKVRVYQARETLSNLVILLVNRLLRPIKFAWTFAVFAAVSPYQPWKMPNTWWSLILAVLVVDFLYYWYHRFHHENRFLWTIHHVHHSSPWMNLSTAFRINWMSGLITPLFFLPAVFLGFSLQQVAVFFAINLLYQFWLHTESIPALPWVEGWLNTPSAHRVHHGSNPLYLDKNHGGLLMVWDRLFGTYQPETEKVVYGVTTGFLSHNPILLNFQPMWDYLRGSVSKEKVAQLPQEPQKETSRELSNRGEVLKGEGSLASRDGQVVVRS